MGNGEIACQEAISPFPTMFSKISVVDASKRVSMK